MPRVLVLGRHSEKKLSCCAWPSTTINPQITQILPSLPHAFDDLYILVNRHVCKPVCGSTGPTNLNRIDLGCSSGAENLARIVRGEITAAASSQTYSSHRSCLPRDHGADRRRVTLFSYQLQSHPIVFVGPLVAQHQRRPAVVRSQDI